MTSHRHIEISRLRKARFVARNERGGELEFGEGDDEAFSPIELLLTAIAGCSAIDVDYITAKRAEADRLDLTISGEKIRDDLGNRLVDLLLEIDAAFPVGEGGDAAREVLAGAVDRSRERICTVSRTVTVGSPLATRLVGEGEQGEDGH